MLKKDSVELMIQRQDSFREDVTLAGETAVGASVSFYIQGKGIEAFYAELKTKNIPAPLRHESRNPATFPHPCTRLSKLPGAFPYSCGTKAEEYGSLMKTSAVRTGTLVI
jgi:hypothetical protein